MDAAAALAAQCTDTQIILNHTGMWADRDLAGWKWKDSMRTLAARPNIAMKISGLGMLDAKWTLESIRPLVLEALEAFGLERAMFASNFPVDSLTSDYRTLWRAFSEITRGFSADERMALLSANAQKFYRIG